MKFTQPVLLCSMVTAATGCKGSTAPTDEAPKQATRPTAAPTQPRADAASAPAETPEARAQRLAHQFIIADGHIDVPYRLEESRDKDGKLTQDIAGATEEGDFDYPRALAGGLDAPFMSIYIPAEYQKKGGGAKKFADGLIDMVEGLVAAAPDKFALALSVDAVRTNFEAKKISLPMGMENGAPIGKDLANLEHFHRRGIRYITLTHSEDNQICDSSYAKSRTWKGLSPFGKKLIPAMNRVGIMIDVSHVSDDTFYQVLELSKAPVIASHSSARHFTPDFERNMSDDMITKLGANGGVVLVNFGSSFIDADSQAYFKEKREAMTAYAKEHDLKPNAPEMKQRSAEWDKDHPPVFASVEDVANHIDHIVKLIGVDHVGFGSDFDGVGDTLPIGLKNVSEYPNLIQVLLERGYSEVDVEKMCGGNFLRVWKAVEDYAASAAAAPPK